ncbi:MAG: cytochrome-c oxidase, cbb3-type subunit I [Planctomycetota bacterium]
MATEIAPATPSTVNPAGKPAANVDQTGLDQFSYDDKVVRYFATATLIWALVGTAAGLLVALLLVLPKLFWSLSPDVYQYLSFARLRPLHTNAAIFAFAGNAIFAAVYYSTQRLCKARMWSDALSWLHFWGWQAIIVAAAVTLPLGITQGKEYAELEWPIDLAIAVVWLGFFGVNFFMTLIHRRERHMYVALWFYIATIVTVTVLHVFNSLVVPIGAWKSYSVYAGVQDAFMQWWYGHNAVAFFLTTPFLGLMYYFLPKAAGRPVFSYKLSILHFWSLVFIYIWAGPHHLHYTALPEWASTLGMLFSVMLWMPSWGGMINGLLTLRGAWHKVSEDPVLKFFVVGVTFYGMATFEGPLLSVKAVNGLSHYTDWTIAHVHSGALGWNGMMSFGMLYWLAPRLFQTPNNQLWSKKAATWHFWLGTLGILAYILPIYAAGITQGLMWRAIDAETGQLAYPDFVETVQSIVWLWWVRVIGGAMFVSGVVLMLVNYVMTWRMRPAQYEVPVHSALPLRAQAEERDHRPAPSRLSEAPVLDAGKKLDVWSKMDWHRRWERLPVKFTVLVVIAVVAASLFEIVPTFLIRSNVPTIASVQPYTPLELAGRDIYVAEGCYNCHSQMVRPMIAETKRYGDYSKPGEFVYDHPFQWGSRRIGPDLQREGGKQSNLWHWLHLEEPEQVSPGSVMPAYEHLLTTEIDFKKTSDRMWAASKLGADYDMALDEAPDHARQQAETIAADIVSQGGPIMMQRVSKDPLMVMDSQAVALIAYLQRLGVDIFQPAPAAETAGEDNETAAEESVANGEPETVQSNDVALAN